MNVTVNVGQKRMWSHCYSWLLWDTNNREGEKSSHIPVKSKHKPPTIQLLARSALLFARDTQKNKRTDEIEATSKEEEEELILNKR